MPLQQTENRCFGRGFSFGFGEFNIAITSNMNPSFMWRTMREEDLDTVNRIAGIVHLDYPESPLVFAERLALFAQGCWIAERVASGGTEAVGYAITHPGIIGKPPALDSLLHHLPSQPDCLYLHDVALLPSARQGGLGASLVARMKEEMAALHLAYATLIAVNGSAAYWQRRGFTTYVQIGSALRDKLAGYDSDACYMVLMSDWGATKQTAE